MKVCVVGAGKRFLSGLSYYTLRLTNAFAREHEVSAILMRQLLPTRLYPGWRRVGAALTNQNYHPAVDVFDGVDWYWIPSIIRAFAFLIKTRPKVVVFQWWSGTVVHSYIALATLARMIGARVIIEFHEVQDPGEAQLRVVAAYTRTVAPILISAASGFVVHSERDREKLKALYRFGNRPTAVIPHGPYDHYLGDGFHSTGRASRIAPDSCCNLLFFGLIRPYKGLADLIIAFDSIPERQISNYWLTIVGETWEGCTEPAALVAKSPYRSRITFENRYVNDEEVGSFFRGADAVVFPYRRSSASGPLHIAMSFGLPVVVANVGGLPEVVQRYSGGTLVAPGDIEALRTAIIRMRDLRGVRFPNPYSWDHTTKHYGSLFLAVLGKEDTEDCISKRDPLPSDWEAAMEQVQLANSDDNLAEQ